MKKITIYILLISIPSLVFFSCTKDLNIDPKNIIQDDAIFSNESGVTAYFASLYYDLPIEDFNYTAGMSGFNQGTFAPNGYLPTLTDEAATTALRNTNSILVPADWDYKPITNVNAFIEKIVNANFTDAQKNKWLGEAKFIRAYYYFGLVKRYGGVPLITKTQVFTGDNLNELKVPRNSEKEIYDFIGNELDEAAELLDATNTNGRANKYVAYALKSRAMLYAASIAKYGTVQLNGLLGIPATEANNYWQAAYDAAKKIMDSGKYSLYNKNADKALNYQNMFLDEVNPEAIFIKEFHYPEYTHSWDNYILPHNLMGGYGSAIAPSVEMVESYEYTDGTPGALKYKNAQGQLIQYTSPTAIFNNKDPRFFATIIYPYSEWHGNIIDVRAGIIDNGVKKTSGNYATLYKGLHIIGYHGIGGSNEVSQTGFYLRKYLQTSYDPTTVKPKTSSQHFIDFRLGEILLNYAEAAVELGKIADAKAAINQIRARAGIKTLTDAEVTLDKVRHERRIELAFEPHRWWDIRRWRIATQILINKKHFAIMPYLVLDNNTYVFETNQLVSNRSFPARRYYEQIPAAEIIKNTNLIQNPGY